MEVLVVAFLIAIPVMWIFTWLAMPKCYRYRAALAEAGKCSGCGYDMAGLERGAKCPECGGSTRGVREWRVGNWALIGSAWLMSVAMGVVITLYFGGGKQVLAGSALVGLVCFLTFIPWIAFASLALKSNECHPGNIVAVGATHAIGIAGGAVLVFASISDEGLLGMLVVSPLAGVLCALVAAVGCRMWNT